MKHFSFAQVREEKNIEEHKFSTTPQKCHFTLGVHSAGPTIGLHGSLRPGVSTYT